MNLDARAALAFTLVIVTALTVFYAMAIGWALTDIVQIASIFVPFVAAAVAFYFGNKNSSDLISNEKKRLENETLKLEIEKKRIP
jgi:hypothetical protein